MKWLLLVLTIDAQGYEEVQKVSEHNTLLSCKATQASYLNIRNKIIYYCSEDQYIVKNSDRKYKLKE